MFIKTMSKFIMRRMGRNIKELYMWHDPKEEGREYAQIWLVLRVGPGWENTIYIYSLPNVQQPCGVTGL